MRQSLRFPVTSNFCGNTHTSWAQTGKGGKGSHTSFSSEETKLQDYQARKKRFNSFAAASLFGHVYHKVNFFQDRTYLKHPWHSGTRSTKLACQIPAQATCWVVLQEKRQGKSTHCSTEQVTSSCRVKGSQPIHSVWMEAVELFSSSCQNAFPAHSIWQLSLKRWQ